MSQTVLAGRQVPEGGGGTSGPLPTYEAVLESNVTLAANTDANALELTLPAGKYFINARVQFGRAATTAQRYVASLWDGATLLASAEMYAPSVNPHYMSAPVHAIITLTEQKTITLKGRCITASSVISATAPYASYAKATIMSAIRLTGIKGDPGESGVSILYGTGNPPSASGVPEGTVYFQYE